MTFVWLIKGRIDLFSSYIMNIILRKGLQSEGFATCVSCLEMVVDSSTLVSIIKVEKLSIGH